MDTRKVTTQGGVFLDRIYRIDRMRGDCHPVNQSLSSHCPGIVMSCQAHVPEEVREEISSHFLLGTG